jgi:hypothetical protein
MAHAVASPELDDLVRTRRGTVLAPAALVVRAAANTTSGTG